MYDVKVLHLLDKVIEFNSGRKPFTVSMIFGILRQVRYCWTVFV